MSRQPIAIGVLADDLTGALAAASRLREGGLRPVVQWRPDAAPISADAIVADLRTRDYGTDPAIRARRWAAHLRAVGCHRLELRTDSTFRGAPAAELAGLLEDADPDTWVLAVPAFPAAGRVTVTGRQRVTAGAPEDLDLDVAACLFGAATPALNVGLDVASAGPDAIETALRAAIADGVRRFVADGTDERHLRDLAVAADRLTAGGSGPPLITCSPGAWLRYYPVAAAGAGYVLAVLSSPTQTNREQLAELTRAAQPLVLPARALLAGAVRVDWAHVTHPAQQPVVVVETLSEPAPDEGGAWLLSTLAAKAAGFLVEDGLDHDAVCAGVVVSGGLTASALMDALGAEHLLAGEEVAPLCPRGTIAGGAWTGLPVLTKGGLVGERGTLHTLVASLHKEI